MLVKRQLRTAFLLILVIIGCVGSGLYIRSRNKDKTAVNIVAPISREIDMALRRFDTRSDEDKAIIQTTSTNNIGQKASLVFWGLTNEETTSKLLKALDQYDIPTTFFVTGSDVTSYPKSMMLIGSSGQSIGIASSNYFSGSIDSVSSRTISDISRTSAAIQSITGMRPMQTLALKEPDDAFLGAVYACSIGTVIVPTKVVTFSQSQSTPANELFNGMARGTILCIRLENASVNISDYIKQLSAT
jgi:peptidoglycan/xylan/chitin deacetylase (PgdA/CDA1 family)